MLLTYLLTYLRSWALPEKLPIIQPFRKFPAILRKPKAHRRVHRSPPLVPILSHLDPVHTIPSYLSKIHFNIVLPPTSWSSSGLFPSGFPTLGPLSKESVHVRGFLWIFVTRLFLYGEELLAPRPTSKLEDHPLSAVRDCLFNRFATSLHIWRPFSSIRNLEDAPCRGDKGPS
jgi:hypothetical protein